MGNQQKKISKTHDCSSPDCVNRYIEKGMSGIVCDNCVEEMKRFVKKL